MRLFENEPFEDQVKRAISMVWSRTQLGAEDFYTAEQWREFVEWLKPSDTQPDKEAK